MNAYSKNDLMLAIMYRQQSWATHVAGLGPVTKAPLVSNIDVSSLISTHAEYATKMPTLLRRIDLDNAALDDHAAGTLSLHVSKAPEMTSGKSSRTMFGRADGV